MKEEKQKKEQEESLKRIEKDLKDDSLNTRISKMKVDGETTSSNPQISLSNLDQDDDDDDFKKANDDEEEGGISFCLKISINTKVVRF